MSGQVLPGQVLETPSLREPRGDYLALLSEGERTWALSSSTRRGAGRRWRSLARALRDPAVGIPAGLLLLILLACFVGPLVLGLPGPDKTAIAGGTNAPLGSAGHLLGTDQLGRDNLSRLLHGGQVSIVVGVGATAVSLVVGTVLGAVAGQSGGVVSAVIMRFFDALLAFPGLILALAIAEFLGPSEWHTIVAISTFGIATYGRLARSQTLRVCSLDYIAAARIDGQKGRKIIFGHVIPNILPPLLAFAMITVGIAMLVEAGLSYLGLGIRPPEPSWGNLIANGQTSISEAPQLIIEPAIALFVTVLALNILGDGLRHRTGRRS